MARGVLITARQIIWLYEPIYQASLELWVDDKAVDDRCRSNIYIHDVNQGNVLEVQIEVRRSADVVMSEINLIYLQHLES